MSHGFDHEQGTRKYGKKTIYIGDEKNPVTGSPGKKTLSQMWEEKYFEKLLLVCVVEGCFLMLETLVSCLAYAFNSPFNGIGPLVTAAMALVAYFTASNMVASLGETYFGNSVLVALNLLQGRVGFIATIFLVTFHFGGRFAGAGLAKLLSDTKFGAALFNKSAGVSSVEALIVEIVGGMMVILLINSMYKKFLRNRKEPNTTLNTLHGIMIFFVVLATQAFAHPITGAAFDPIRWIAVTAVGGGYWGWWYPVASVIVLAAAFGVSFLYSRFKKMVNKAAEKVQQ